MLALPLNGAPLTRGATELVPKVGEGVGAARPCTARPLAFYRSSLMLRGDGRVELLQGTLNLLILRTLFGPAPGHGIARGQRAQVGGPAASGTWVAVLIAILCWLLLRSSTA